MGEFVKKFRPVEVEEVKRETEKALLVTIEGTDHWMPKSQCGSEMTVGDSGELLITEWIGGEKGLFEKQPITTAGHSAPPRAPDDGIPF